MKRISPWSAIIAAVAAITIGGTVVAQADTDPAVTTSSVTYQQAVDGAQAALDYLKANPPVTASPTATATPTVAPTTVAPTVVPTTVAPTTTTPVPTTTTAAPVSTHASGLPWSDGGYFEHSAATATAFGTWRGLPVDNYEAFTSRATWAAQLNNWWAASVPSTFVPSRDDFIISVPLWTDDGQAGTDAQWTSLANSIKAVDSNAYVRLGWEFNCCFSLATNATTWKAQFSRAATLLKAAAPNLKIVWNPNEGASGNGTLADPTSLFVPGKVDVVAIDAYDWYPAYNSDANWAAHRDKTYGWNYWYNFAQTNGLPFALAEFSVYSGSTASGGDNPAYFTYVYNWLASKASAAPNSIAFVSLFNDPNTYCKCNLYPTTTNPNAGVRYKALLAALAH